MWPNPLETADLVTFNENFIVCAVKESSMENFIVCAVKVVTYGDDLHIKNTHILKNSKD